MPKKSVSPKKKSIPQNELLEQVLTNSALLQTKLTDIIIKLNRLIKIFEAATKEISTEKPESIGNIIEKLDNLERQNKSIAKTIRLFEIYLREELKPKTQPRPAQEQYQSPTQQYQPSTFQSPFKK